MTVKPKVYRCAGHDEAFETTDLKVYVAHLDTHLKPLTLEPAPMWFYVYQDELLGSELELVPAIDGLKSHPKGTELVHHTTLKRRFERARRDTVDGAG